MKVLTFSHLVVPGRFELPTSTLSVWRSNQLSYRTVRRQAARAPGLSPDLQLSIKTNSRQEAGGQGPQKKTGPHDQETGVSRKEVFQPHLPVRLPCYDLAPITGFTLGRNGLQAPPAFRA